MSVDPANMFESVAYKAVTEELVVWLRSPFYEKSGFFIYRKSKCTDLIEISVILIQLKVLT
jgi:hypothetical protein